MTLEVDHSLLTPELAKEMNEFWSSAEYRRREENGDDVRAIIRFAGMVMINIMLEQGGASFMEGKEIMGLDSAGPLWTKDLHDEEGFGPSCGIRVVAATVASCDYYDVELEEVDREA